MGCMDYRKCKNYNKKCNQCSRWYLDKFEAIEIKDNECQCISCKKIFTDRIFRLKDDPERGLCFDCY